MLHSGMWVPKCWRNVRPSFEAGICQAGEVTDLYKGGVKEMGRTGETRMGPRSTENTSDSNSEYSRIHSSAADATY